MLKRILSHIHHLRLHLQLVSQSIPARIGLFLLPAIILICLAATAPSSYGSNHKTISAFHEPAADERITIQADSLYTQMQLAQSGLQFQAFLLAFKGYQKMLDLGMIAKRGLLSIADFSLPSNTQRFFVVDMQHGKLLFKTWVAHGRNSGRVFATDFSNQPASFKSSLGFYLTLRPYYGDKGYALKLQGIEAGINDNAFERAIVIHGADYVNEKIAATQGYLGRSLGCPALPMQLNKKVINTIREGSCFFIYHPNPTYLNNSKLLNS
ncbi:MAG: murein L,D-transpeptidase catalytic domain family protein [Bacteroidetes bacterium]|nr:murein L,D-transpeptidase catalytic domain family protein [Bacteroidota bacterium]